MPQVNSVDLASALSLVAYPIKDSPKDYDVLLERIGDSRIVLLGEASHGTHEFYRERALITRRLIEEKGFEAVAVEADWPDAYRVNRFVKGSGDVLEGADPLSGFKRFPQWMWRNSEVLDFVIWLRQWNDRLDGSHAGSRATPGGSRRKAGFYGLDLYSLHASIEAVLLYLDQVDAEAAMRARERYACFQGSGGDNARYGFEASLGITPDCEQAAVQQLLELRRKDADNRSGGESPDGDELFQAEQNARLIVDAERYYRTMFMGQVVSWNVRDQHMADTLSALAGHLAKMRGGPEPAKIVVWAHNSHLGDARATESVEHGETNLGQIMRERHGHEVYSVGMTTYTGTVMAASDWGALAETKRVRPALAGSYEHLFHETGVERFLLDFREDNDAIRELVASRLERAIGVIYRPETERISHYFNSTLPSQFDAVLHFDHTRAVDPLGSPDPRIGEDIPDTFPSAI
jgi:erythromycin esterase-like protein